MDWNLCERAGFSTWMPNRLETTLGRLGIIDGLRGACLVFMTLSHLQFTDRYLLSYAHFRELGFADSAQAFMFLSGLLVGLTGTRLLQRKGPAVLRRRYVGRALVLYGCHLGMLLALLLASRLLPDSWPAWGDWLQHLFDDGQGFAAATALLLYQPTYLDILPQYMLFLLGAPLLLGLVARGQAGLALGVSLSLWLVSQAGLHAPVIDVLEPPVFIAGSDIVFRSGFNPLGWQLVFSAGLVLGAMLERQELSVESLRSETARGAAQLAAVLLVTFAVLRLGLSFGLFSQGIIERLAVLERRQDFGLLPTLNFAALAYLIAWLIVAAPQGASVRLAWIGRRLTALLTHPRLSLLGRHCLPVFVYHVLLAYALRYACTALGGVADPAFSLLVLAAIASLFLAAMLLEAIRRPVGVARAA